MKRKIAFGLMMGMALSFCGCQSLEYRSSFSLRADDLYSSADSIAMDDLYSSSMVVSK